MKTRKVISREYKLMLQAAKFAGRSSICSQSPTRSGRARRCDRTVRRRADGALDTISKERLVSFLDTQARHLWVSGYVLRLRRTLEGSRPEVTLKFRHPDRYVAASRQMKSRRIRATVKFEEDIKPPFVSLYGFSTSATRRQRERAGDTRRGARLLPRSRQARRQERRQRSSYAP
jgi:hypothetical protein